MIVHDPHSHGNVFIERVFQHVALWTALTSLGCAGGDLDADAPLQQIDRLPQSASPDASSPDAGSAAPFVAEISASGTGCRAGSWQVEVSPDGARFRATLSDFIALVQDTRSLDVKDCLLSVRLRSATALSFAVTNLAYSGFAYLESGVRGYQGVNAYFHGSPAGPSEGNHTDLTGPLDRRYRLERTFPIEDQVWSPCGRERLLQVFTQLRVRRSQNRATGYMTMSAADGYGDDLTWRIAAKPCVDPREVDAIMDAGESAPPVP